MASPVSFGGKSTMFFVILVGIVGLSYHRTVWMMTCVVAVGVAIWETWFRPGDLGYNGRFGYARALGVLALFGFGALMILRQASEIGGDDFGGKGWYLVLCCLAINGGSDTGGQVVGAVFGDRAHKNVVWMSSGKSIEGFVGAFIGGAVTAYFTMGWMIDRYGAYRPGDDWLFIAMCMQISLLAIMFDLFASVGKRHMHDPSNIEGNGKVEDWSRALLSHGGVMDRFDAAVAVALQYTANMQTYGVI